MDPITREPSPSYLPIACLIVAVLALIIGGVALASASKAKGAAASAQAALAEQASRISGFEESISTVRNTADAARTASNKLVGEVNSAFQQIAGELTKVTSEVAKLQEVASRAPSARPTGGAVAAAKPVAGPGEYLVKASDTGMKIASANGVSIGDLQAVNPGVNWNALKVGQKLKLPKK